MPYIPTEERAPLDRLLSELEDYINTPGKRTYCAYVIAVGFNASKNYATMSSGRATLLDAYDSLTDEFLAYERRKREDNGSIL